jgi:hypothetical protein
MNHTPAAIHRQGGGVSVWHPESLDVDALLDAYSQRIAEGVLWLGHCIYVGLADDARCRDSGRVPLKAAYLRNVIGRHHLDAVRQAALEVGYVGRDPSYRAGSHSQSYWLLPPYDRAGVVQRELRNAGLRHNVSRWWEARRRATWQRIRAGDSPVSLAVATHLWRNLQRVRLDEGIDFADTPPAHRIAAEQLRQGDLWFTVDAHGRLHTNLTSLPRWLRSRLTVDGFRLVNVDISESQPLFLGLALALTTDRHESRGRGQGTGGTGTHPHHLMLDNTMLDSAPQFVGKSGRRRLPADMRRYLETVEARGLYRAVAGRLRATRDEVKRRVLAVFFDKPGHHNRVSRVMDELFPGVMAAMRQAKWGDYRRLAHFAQRIESAFMFGRVMPRIMAARLDLFVGTIHDSILTTAGDAEFVREVMLDEFARLGLQPQVNVEPCSGACCGKKFFGRGVKTA